MYFSRLIWRCFPLTSVVPVAAIALLAGLAGGAQAQNAAQTQAQILQMQEQMRALNGRVEELTFQLLQLQELLRKTRELNEERFLELEDAAGLGKQGSLRQRDGQTAPATDDTIRKIDPAGNDGSGSDVARRAEPPRDLGTLTVDEQGNVTDSALGKPLDLKTLNDPLSDDFSRPATGLPGVEGPVRIPGTNGDDTSLTSPDTTSPQDGALSGDGDDALLAKKENGPVAAPDDLYDAGYKAMLDGRYGDATRHFSTLLDAYPESSRAPNARYWLGESLFAQGDFNDAAEQYLAMVNTYPDADLAPDAMLKLGLALISMGQTQVACSTFDELLVRYPDSSNALKQRLSRERASARCA